MKKTKIFSYVIPFASVLLASSPNAAKIKPTHKLYLDTCNVNITADSVQTNDNVTTYSGNVKILVGFASLRSTKVTVKKNPNGSCEIITS